MKKPLPLILFVLALVLLGAYNVIYPPRVLERKTEKALLELARVVSTKDRAQINAALQELLATPSQVHLDVNFSFLMNPQGNQPMKQDFDKTTFISFIDNVLYPLTDYEYRPHLESFTLSSDRKSADVTFSSKEWADGTSLFSGTALDMRFSSETTCSGHVLFDGGQVMLDKASCEMELRAVPKPGQEKKLQTPEALRQLMR